MTGGSDTNLSPAITRTIELLEGDFTSNLRVRKGFIDLIGETRGPRPPIGQRVFHSRLVPPIYERLWRPLAARFLSGKGLNEAEERRSLLRMLDLSPGDLALDVGCGPGNYTRLLADSVGRGLAVGIDPSEAMITAAVRRKGGASLAYIRGNGDKLPFRDAEFDGVCCVGVIHLLSDPMGALDEMVRMLAPGGRIALAATCRMGRERRTDRVGLTVFERDELTDALAARGMTQIEQRVAKRWQLVAARRSEVKV